MATLMYGRERASWILNHAGPFTFQRTRGQRLQLAFDEHTRRNAGVHVNPHVQGITERLFLRRAESPAAVLELTVVVGAAILFPIGWPAGIALYRWLTRKVQAPAYTLHTIPITTLAWIGAALMTIAAVVLDPGGSSLAGVLAAPFVMTQCAGTFLMASVYGILEGWLSVPGSTDWYPFPPRPLPSSPSLAKDDTDRPNPAVPGATPPPPMRTPRDPRKRPWEQ